MITLKSAREIEAMDRAGDFLASIHIGLRDLLKPGVDMWEVEEYVRRRCKEENVLPLQIGVEGSIMDYPYATCCGLNDEVAHAFPRHYILKDGDLLKVDMVLSEPIDKSVLDVSKLDFDNVAQVKKYTESYTGGLADSCWAYAIGTPSDEVKNLMEVTREAMYLGIEQAVVGNRIGDIGAAIQEYAESRGYGVVRDLVGHGEMCIRHRLHTELGGTLFIWLSQLVLSSLFSWLRKNFSRIVSLVGGFVCVVPSRLTVKILVRRLSSILSICLRRVIVA